MSLTGPANYILGGWELGAVENFRTGLPIDMRITRADVVYRDKRNGRIYTSPVIVGGVVQTDAVINTPGGGSSRGVRRPDAVAGGEALLGSAGKNGFVHLPPFLIPR